MTAFEDSAIRDLAPFRRERLDVLAQPHRDAPNDLAFPLVDPGPAGVVRGGHPRAELRVGPPSGGREVHQDRPPVARIATAGDEPGLLEPIEMARHRGSLDPDAFRELALSAALRLGDHVEDEEVGKGLAIRGQDLLEVASERLGRVYQFPRDRALERTG